MTGILSAQNLVPNQSFEIYSTCPLTFGGSGPTLAPPWVAPTPGTPDIFNACSTSNITDVPDNNFGDQPALTGDGYAGGYCKISTHEYREYIQAPLITPLVGGLWYSVGFYVSPGELGCAIQHLGAYLSVTPPTSNSPGALSVTPQVEYNMGYLNDFTNWTLISGCFIASGGEAYITIGNFQNDPNTPMEPGCNEILSYYFFEDVFVEQIDPPSNLPLDLGGPVFECFSYEIDPGITGYLLTWEDGSHDPTLVVSESGTYSLTISDGCNFGIDSIEVMIGGIFDPVDLGPDELTICEGDEYTFSFDPDLSTYTWQDGSHDQEYSISEPGLYSLTLDDGCAMSSDEIEVFVQAPPEPISLGEDLILCFGDEIELSLDSLLGDFTWQDNSSSSVYLVYQGGTYAVTVSNMCGAESDDIVITDLEVPEVELGPDELSICDGDIIEFDIDPDLGDIVWQDGNTSSIYEINAAGLYTLYISNECGTGSDQVAVDVVDLPAATLGPDTLVCDSGVVILTTTAVEGMYLWQDNSNNDSLIVTSPGLYGLTITNFCGASTDQILVEYGEVLSQVVLGPDTSLCPGEELILYTDHQEADYLWQDGSTADSFLVNSAGTYVVMLSNACSAVTDSINISVNNNPPTVDLPAQLSLCQGQTLTLDAGINGVSYLWNDNSQNQHLFVSSPGTYSLTVSNACGADQDTVIILDGGPAPVVSLGNDVQLCPGDHVLLTPSFSNVDSWLWQDGSTSPSFDISSPGWISVTVSNACGSAFDTLQVDLLPATPQLDLGPDTSLCSGQSFTLSISTPGVSILWPDGSTDPDFVVASPGDVIASVSNSCGISFDTLVVDALPDIPALDLGPDQSLCLGETIIIDPGISEVDYLWHDGSVSASYQSTQQERIILTISNDCGLATDTLEIIESTQGPQVNLGPDIQECEGGVITIPSGISGVNYLWQDGSTNSDYITSLSGTIILQVSNNCGSDADTLLVDISGTPPSAALGPDTTLCEGSTLLLISNADAITSILWQDGSSETSFSVSAAGTFILSESNRCGEDADTITVDYLDKPDPFTLGPDTILCPGEFITLTAPSTAFDILWQNGSSDETIIADQPLLYSLQLSNDCGVVSDDLLLAFDTNIPAIDLGPDLDWCEGDVFTLDASQSFIANYTWSTGSNTSSIEISTPGVYSVDVHTYCHQVSDEVIVSPGMDCITAELNKEIFIPNVFSPNGDGMNDLFLVTPGPDINVTSMNGSVYDRWGNLVYHSDAIPFSWDGLTRDKDAMPGVYILVLRWELYDQGVKRTESAHGDVTLIR